ncbi:hypothetical protein MMC28_002796 [Mycoblastus sanguinarius]|nr:hypothetical protein [Mycoblastus sanguinarius]
MAPREGAASKQAPPKAAREKAGPQDKAAHKKPAEKPAQTPAQTKPVEEKSAQPGTAQKKVLASHVVVQIHLADPILQPPPNKPLTTRKLATNEDTHERSDKINSFLVCHKSEPKCAVYLGFTDLR